jgi:uncharacterized protein (TIGR00255 family)
MFGYRPHSSSKAAAVLLSMTGFGEARSETDIITANVEVRAVNNRYLKVTVRGSEPYPMLEAEIEKVVRRHIRRGSLLVQVRVDRQQRYADVALNTTALRSYLRQIREVCDELGQPEYAGPLLAGVLAMPGIADEARRSATAPPDEWPVVERILEDALRALEGMRREEGLAMGNELLTQHHFIAEQVELIRGQLPQATADYRRRMLERIRQAIGDAGIVLQPDHLIREVALFADRIDVSEEVTRLASHLEQFAEIVRKGDEAAGRKLEFVAQEMGRETNTIGSKAGDVSISRAAVEIKAALEKIRELVQNVE